MTDIKNVVREVKLEEIKKIRKLDVILTKEQFYSVVKKLGYSIDDKGIIIDPKTKEAFTSFDSHDIKIEELGAIVRGNSPQFVKDNIVSYSQYLAKKGRV